MRARFTGGSDAGCCAASGTGIATASTSAARIGRRMRLFGASHGEIATPSGGVLGRLGRFRGAGLQPCASVRRVLLTPLPDDRGHFVAGVIDLCVGGRATEAEPEGRAREIGIDT